MAITRRNWSDSNDYWQQISKGASARSELAHSQYTEYSAFTGTDIKAFILPQGDEVAKQEAIRRLEELDRALNVEVQKDAQNQRSPIEFSDGPTPFRAVNNPLGLPADFADYVETTRVPTGEPDILPLINMQSLTISTFRAKSQVRALGHVNAVGLARGSRTVAGTFILTEFGRDSFWNILAVPIQDQNVGDTGVIQPDQMRPFDIILLFAHEMGNLAIRHLYGCEIVTNGVVYSIQDYYSENTVSYMAQDVSPLIPLSPVDMRGTLGPYDHKDWNKDGSTYKLNNLITTIRGATLDQHFLHLKNRRNPFR